MTFREIDAQLRNACGQGNLALVKLLLSQGADVNSDEGAGFAALHYAANKGHAEVVKVLIDVGADLKAQSNKVGWTPLHFAAVEGRGLDAAIALLNAGADATLTDSMGRTPFDMSNGLAVRDYYESRLAAKAISEAFASGPADDGATTGKRGLSL